MNVNERSLFNILRTDVQEIVNCGVNAVNDVVDAYASIGLVAMQALYEFGQLYDFLNAQPVPHFVERVDPAHPHHIRIIDIVAENYRGHAENYRGQA